MSRCFPFPPPGYERKLRVDDDDLLTKEKDNEKKRKRDNDKEKKERKEKDKDRSKEKHRERRKEKKEKHKHKDKDKDKKKDKDQSRDEKRFRGEGIVEKVSSSSPPSSQLTSSSPAQALGGKNGYVDGATGNESVHSSNNGTFHGRGEILDSVVSRNNGFGCGSMPGFDQKVNGQRDNGQTRFPKVSIVCNLGGVDQRRVGTIRPVERTINKTTKEREKEKNHRSDQRGETKGEKHKGKDAKRFEGQAETKDTTCVQTLGKRIRVEKNGAIGSQVIAKVSVPSQKRAESIGKLANGNVTSYSLHAKETSKLANGNGIHKTENGERGNNESRSPKVAFVHNSKGLEQRRSEMDGPSDMGKKRPIEGAGRTVYGGIGVFGNNKEKKILPKDERRNTVQEEEKVKQGGDYIIKLSRLGGSCEDSTVSSRQYTLKASNNGVAKRKALEANGFLHGNETRPEKLPRTVVSSPSPIGDGKKLQSCPTVTLSAHKQGATNSLKPNNEGNKANRILGAQESPLVSTKPPSAIAKANKAIGALDSLIGSTKPPSSILKANGVMDVRKSPTVAQKSLIGSTKPPNSTRKANGVMVARESPMGSTKPPSSIVKPTNGMIFAQESSIGSIKPPSPAVEANGKTLDANGLPLHPKKPPSTSTKPKKHKEKSSSKPRPPHSDTKYLSHILSIPKIEEWSGFDDQEWLFEKNRRCPSKETKVGSCSSTSERDVQVWAKAIHIEPVDLYALPYVIPY